MTETVIKVGGSLGKGHGLSNLMLKTAELGHRHKILVVPGGGAFADVVRDHDRRFGLHPDTAHWMAVLAMDQYGYLLSSLIPEGELVQDMEDARKVAASGHVPVLLPHNLLRQADPLPRNWDVTSDSIAAWVAGRAEAKRLILLKSVDGLFERENDVVTAALVLEKIRVNQLSRCRGVDRYFASILEEIELEAWVINGNHPERLAQLLDTGHTMGTCLL